MLSLLNHIGILLIMIIGFSVYVFEQFYYHSKWEYFKDIFSRTIDAFMTFETFYWIYVIFFYRGG